MIMLHHVTKSDYNSITVMIKMMLQYEVRCKSDESQICSGYEYGQMIMWKCKGMIVTASNFSNHGFHGV